MASSTFRAYDGGQSRWYQAAVRQEAGRIRAAGITKKVVFEPVDSAINAEADDRSSRVGHERIPRWGHRRAGPARRVESRGSAGRSPRVTPISTSPAADWRPAKYPIVPSH